MGLAIPIAGALATAATREGLAAPTLALQDGGKTLVVAIPQATVQLDPAIAGSNGYGDILPLVDNITEGLTRFKPGTSRSSRPWRSPGRCRRTVCSTSSRSVPM